MTRIRAVLAVAAIVSMGACAPSATRTDGGMVPVRTTLLVENSNWSSVNVYLVRGTGLRTRLGSVEAMGKAEFNIPRAFVVGVSDVVVQAEPLGTNDSYVSPSIQVFPGSRLALKVTNALQHSTFAVYAAH